MDALSPHLRRGGAGITGHGHEAPATHLEALRRYPFDTVMTPWDFVFSADEGYRRDLEALVEEIERQDAGLMTIKTVARRNWPDGNPLEGQWRATWYEPLEEQEYVDAAVSFVLAQGDNGHPHRRGRRLDRDYDRGRKAPDAARGGRRSLSRAPDYSSPFISVPF